MSNPITPDNVVRARNKLAGLYAHGGHPNPDEEATARRTLATAKIDREMRRSLADGGPLDPVQVGHLVGLLLSSGGSDSDSPARLERAIRDGLYVTGEHLSTTQRASLAALLTAEGEL